MSQVTSSALDQTSQTPPALLRAIEATWLAAVVAVPLALVHKDWMFSSVDMPKVFVLRSLALALIALVALEWAITSGRGESNHGPVKSWLRRLGFVDHPASWVFIGAAAVLLANVVSVAFSPVRAVSIGGVDAGTDSYGLLSIASYVTIFWVTATHLKSAGQLQRLVWAIVATGAAMGLVGVGQHFGFDPLHNNPARSRMPLTAGNAGFAGSLLVITIPLTLAASLALRERMAMIPHIAGSIGLLSLGLVAMVFTLARSSWVGLAIALLVLVGGLGWVHGLGSLRRFAVVGASLAGLVLLLGVTSPSTTKDAIERLSSIPSSVTNFGDSDLAIRGEIWSAAVRAYRSGDWVDVADQPDIPAIAPKPLLRLVGFGPNTFEYANFATRGPTGTQHAHNFLLHTLVELGSLGVAAYLGLLFASGLVLVRMLLRARAEEMPLFYSYIVIGLAAVAAGRLVEQMAGKAQVADLTLSWVLAAVVVAMASMTSQSGLANISAPAPRRNSRPRRRPEARGTLPLQRARLAGAGLLIMIVLVFWWQSVLLTAASSVSGASALQSGKLGLRDATIEGYERAIARAPSLALNHMALADVYRTLATVAPDDASKVSLLTEGDRLLTEVLTRNPLDHRSLEIQVDIRTRKSALLSTERPAAYETVRTLIALQPGYWSPYAQLAELFVLDENYEAALAARDQAVERVPHANNTTAFDTALRALNEKLPKTP